jgi:hypothetical protein
MNKITKFLGLIIAFIWWNSVASENSCRKNA